jgi:hypothetical protein
MRFLRSFLICGECRASAAGRGAGHRPPERKKMLCMPPKLNRINGLVNLFDGFRD